MITTENELFGNIYAGAIAVCSSLFIENLLNEIGRIDDDRSGRPNLQREEGPVCFGPCGEPADV